MYAALLVLQLLFGLAVTGLILLQHGKGADVGAAFGAGASGTLFGARGSASFLSRATAGLAIAFIAIFGYGMGSITTGGGTGVLQTSGKAISIPGIEQFANIMYSYPMRIFSPSIFVLFLLFIMVYFESMEYNPSAFRVI